MPPRAWRRCRWPPPVPPVNRPSRAFTGSLAHELSAFGVRVRLIGPGDVPTTQFAANPGLPVARMIPEAYADFAGPVLAAFANPPLTTHESDVAGAVWQAATDGSDRQHYPAGADAVALATAGQAG